MGRGLVIGQWFVWWPSERWGTCASYAESIDTWILRQASVCVCATFADEQTINPLRANWLLNKLVPISMCVRVSLVLMLLVFVCVCVCMSSLIEKLNVVVAAGERGRWR